MTVPAACLFDLDGLLLNTEPLHGLAWGTAAAHFGTTLSPEQLLELRGRRRLDCADQVVSWLDVKIHRDELLAIQQPIARRLMPTAEANPWAEALVTWCADHTIPMALVTSSARDSVIYKTAAHPWIESITTRILGDDPELKAGKPAPDPFQLAAQRLGVRAEESWAFEDSTAGSLSALAAGCKLWVLAPANHSGPDWDALPQTNQWQRVESLEHVLMALKLSKDG